MTLLELQDMVAFQSGSMGSYSGFGDLDAHQQVMITQYLQDGYNRLLHDYYKLWYEESCVLDSEGNVPVSTLTYTYNDLLGMASTQAELYSSTRVYSSSLNPLDQALNPRTYFPPGETVWIRYAVAAGDLNTLGSPSQLPTEHHGLLADYATWRMMSVGPIDKQQRAQFFYIRFMDGASKIKPYGVTSRDTHSFINLFT